MKLTWVQRVLAMVVVLLVMAASSQAAVCELACGFETGKVACHAVASSTVMVDAVGADMMGMDGHCAHGMHMPAMQVAMEACHDGTCSHVSAPVPAKAGPGVVAQFAAVQWVETGVVPAQLDLSGATGAGMRPPLPAMCTGLLVVSLRV